MERLRRRADFRAASSGPRASAGGFVLQARLRRGDDDGIRVGFTVSRQVGNAVERNRVRRRLREIVRLAARSLAAGNLATSSFAASNFGADQPGTSEVMQNGHDYVLIGRRPALTLPFAEMQRQFGTTLHRVHSAESGRDTAGSRRDRHLHETGPSRPKPRDT